MWPPSWPVHSSACLENGVRIIKEKIYCFFQSVDEWAIKERRRARLQGGVLGAGHIQFLCLHSWKSLSLPLLMKWKTSLPTDSTMLHSSLACLLLLIELSGDISHPTFTYVLPSWFIKSFPYQYQPHTGVASGRYVLFLRCFDLRPYWTGIYHNTSIL